MFYTVLLHLKTWSNSHSASLFNVCSGNHFSSFVTLQKFKCTLEREMILTKCDCDDSFHERLLDLFSLYSLRYNFPQSCSGRVSSPNPLPANFGTEVLFDVATKSPICCHIDFLGAGVSRSEGRDLGPPVVGAGVCPECDTPGPGRS